MESISLKSISGDELATIKEKKLLIINDIRKDYEVVLEYTVKPKIKGGLSKIMIDSGIEFVNPMDDLIEVLLERKDSKYAALTVELASAMEAFLQEVYKASNNDEKKYNTRNKPAGMSVIEAIEFELENYVYIGKMGNLEY